MGRKRILAFDGGGVRGVLPLVLTRRLNARPELTGWLDNVALYAGTSSGSLQAAAMAGNIPLDDVLRLYTEHIDELLTNRCPFGLNLLYARYRADNYSRQLRALFGELQLDELEKKIAVPAFVLDRPTREPRTWGARVINNYPGGPLGTSKVYDVVHASSAGPTYLPTHLGHVDGGIFANNPALCGLALLRNKEDTDLDDIRLLSFGTGDGPDFIAGDHDWGILPWLRHLPDLVLESGRDVIEWQCHSLLGSNHYHRAQPLLPDGLVVAQDDKTKIGELIDFAESYPLEPVIDWIRTHWL